ncbi:hypothetical protein Ahy_B08g090325 [Arachis hypogaea]|uniref:Uncharacterized protein n=1 Tax=Arachis hypogaea TaxID=3818 RepID=A0A444Y003_ARAHY|nr:hypothetical protein Ahy_B08g090325 [Arachis hypogaea]
MHANGTLPQISLSDFCSRMKSYWNCPVHPSEYIYIYIYISFAYVYDVFYLDISSVMTVIVLFIFFSQTPSYTIIFRILCMYICFR